MKDFSEWSEYEGNSEGSGRSEKIWLKNNEQTGLFKFKKDENTTDHVSECLAYQLATRVGIECAKFELGTYNGREGSISYNIIEKPEQHLTEGIDFISRYYPQYDPVNFYDRDSGAMYSIEMIEEAVSSFIPMKDFLSIPLFDYLIGNSDRHQSNWGILFEAESCRLSPLYDNSSSLCAYMSDKQISEAYIGNDRKRWNALIDTKSRSLIRCTKSDAERPTHLQMLEYISRTYYNETKELARCIIETLTEEFISKLLEGYEGVLPHEKRIVIQRFLKEKINKMRQVYFYKENNICQGKMGKIIYI